MECCSEARSSHRQPSLRLEGNLLAAGVAKRLWYKGPQIMHKGPLSLTLPQI